MKTQTLLSVLVLLACVGVCSTARCHCVHTVPAVYSWNVADVLLHEPRPYCRKREVIVVLKSGKQRCLDPYGDFAAKLLRAKKEQMDALAAPLENTTS